MSHQPSERAGGRDKVRASRVWGSSLSLWPGGDRLGTDVAAGLVRRGSEEVTHCSLKPKCIPEGNFSKRNVDSGSEVISSTSLLRCLQCFKDLPKCINEEMMRTGSGGAVRSLGSTCDPCFSLMLCSSGCFVLQALTYFLLSLSELQLPESLKLGLKMKIIMGRDGNGSAPWWLPAFYITWSSLQKQGETS